MKWKALKDSEGNWKEAGFVELTPGAGETVVEFDDVDKDVAKSIKSRRSDTTSKHDAFLALDPSSETGATKAIIEFLQEKYG